MVVRNHIACRDAASGLQRCYRKAAGKLQKDVAKGRQGGCRECHNGYKTIGGDCERWCKEVAHGLCGGCPEAVRRPRVVCSGRGENKKKSTSMPTSVRGSAGPHRCCNEVVGNG